MSHTGIPRKGWEPDVKTNKAGPAQANQLFSYQLYQQAVNAATPTQMQLNAAAGQSNGQAGAIPALSNSGILGNSIYSKVNLPNQRAQSVSACAQNEPTFVATSLLPKVGAIGGLTSFDINAPGNALATQNFLSATQQLGTDTVMSSLRNPSYDIRNNIPNPINVVSPWMNTTITPDLERRPLDCFVPTTGIYGCGPNGCSATPPPSGAVGRMNN